MSIKNGTSFICPYYLKNSLFSYGKILLRYSYLFIFINVGLNETIAKVYRTLRAVSVATGFFPIKLTQRYLVKLI